MPSYRRTPAARRDPRGPLIFDLRSLSRRPGSMRSERRSVPAPTDLGTPMLSIPKDAVIELDAVFESVTEGVLVTATAATSADGECARCLEPLRQPIEVRCQELFTYERQDGADEDGYALHGDLLDLEPALRDALVLALPLAPLCQDDCPGLCPECGELLAKAGPDHGHERIDSRWASLRGAVTGAGQDDPAAAST